MTARGFISSFFTIAIALVMVFALADQSSWAAITLPTPTVIFDGSVDDQWNTAGNWGGSAIPTPVSSADVKIADGKTASVNQYDVNGVDVDSSSSLPTYDQPYFGTLTLGENSTLKLTTGGSRGFPTGSDIYFMNGSVLEYTSGNENRDSNKYVPAGVDATIKVGGSMLRGSISGDGNLNIILSNKINPRWDASGMTGDVTFTSNNTSARKIENFGTWGSSTQAGPGITTIGENVYLQQGRDDRISDTGTLKLVGAGGPDYKYYYSREGDDAIGNLIIESPTQSGPYMIMGGSTNSGALVVNNTATFQGTAGTVQIEATMYGHYQGFPRASKVNINAGNLVFQGSGDWTINGTINTTNSPPAEGTTYSDGYVYHLADFAPGSIGIANGGDVTTDTNVTVNAPFDAPNGFTKKGVGTLTLNVYDPLRYVQGNKPQDFNPKGVVNVDAGTLAIGGNASLNETTAINVGVGGNFVYNSSTPLTVAPTLNGAGISSRAVVGGSGEINVALTLDDVGDTLSPGNSPGLMPITTGQTWASYSYNWEVISWNGDLTGTGVAGTNFDQINITGALDLSGTGTGDYILNVLSLDGSDAPGDVADFAETDQSWTILTASGGITGFDENTWLIDSSGFTNLYTGDWSLEQASFGAGGDALVLNYTVAGIPEPSTIILAALGLMGVTFRRRRK